MLSFLKHPVLGVAYGPCYMTQNPKPKTKPKT